MVVTHILSETYLFEQRAVAFASDLPVALFHESVFISRGPRLGTHHDAVLGERPPGLDGGFCETQAGETVFLRLGKAKSWVQGARLGLRIVTEAQGGKCARGVPATRQDASITGTPLELWAAGLPGHAACAAADTPEARDAVDLAFEVALAPSLTLPGGGRLRLSRTPALTAIDIDSAGRKVRGTRAGAALETNLEAARESAHQLALRGLGGLVVVDCVAPVSKAHRQEIKSAFLSTFRGVSARQAAALAPSPFGLLEASLARAECPIDEVLGQGAGAPSPIGQLLQGLRTLERTLAARPRAAVVLALPEAAFNAVEDQRAGPRGLETELTQRLGARVGIEISPSNTIEVVEK